MIVSLSERNVGAGLRPAPTGARLRAQEDMNRRWSDHALLFQPRDLFPRESGETGIDGFVVVPDGDRTSPDFARRQGKMGSHSGPLYFPDLAVVPLNMDAARVVVRVFSHVLAVHDRATGDLRGVQG